MTKDLWLNLPVKNVEKSREFFTRIGFTLNSQHGNTEHSASFLIGTKPIVLMLFDEATFRGFVQRPVSDPKQGAEFLISIDAESQEEVDDLAEKVFEAGGTIFSPPSGQGWMYGCAFADPDGHLWNVLYMDFSQMPTL